VLTEGCTTVWYDSILFVYGQERAESTTEQPVQPLLNITNGDSTVDIMKQAGVPGILLPWRDILHDGPVPDGLSLEDLSKVRAKFIADRGWGAPEAIEQGFIARDNVLRSCEQYENVILWFEHDLYDQLQLLQILDWYDNHRPIKPKLAIICVDQYLGTLSPEQMAMLYRYEQTVTEDHLALASKAWSAFRASTPEQWFALLQMDTRALPYLAGAIFRQLQEYPDCRHGLSRTALQALNIIAHGEQRPGRVFALYQETEERRFLGDASFWVILHELLESSPPLLKLAEHKTLTLPFSPDQALTITPAGEAVLAGKSNWLNSFKLDRWMGGVHLTSSNLWCWDPLTTSITKVT